MSGPAPTSGPTPTSGPAPTSGSPEERIAPPSARLGQPANEPAPQRGVRVVLDARLLQEGERAPTSAAYLGELLAAFARRPIPGESFALLLRSDLDDPSEAILGLDVVGRRLLPPTRVLRAGALTLDPFLLSGASVGAAWRAERSGAAGAVFHAVGAATPLFAQIPVVVTLLDLAPWELTAVFQRGAAARLGQRLRARFLREAAAVIVGSDAVAAQAHRLLHVRRERLRVVRLAPRPAFRVSAAARKAATGRGAGDDAHRLGLPARYLVYPGRFDARQDLATLLGALGELARAGRPDALPADEPWPPRVLLVGASPDDRAAIARAAMRHGVGDALAYTPALDAGRLAGLIRGARAVVLPVLSEGAGLTAIESLAAGVPVVGSAVGALPEIIGPAGLLVEPRDVDRLAVALSTVMTNDALHAQIAAEAAEHAAADIRTWDDVADETRAVYAEVGARA